ncbi:receptor-type tyrosine-protein phosphatase C-like isoform X2 [Nelusetta ayraudi]|uniref:receptor-type tyrosine-protein phosphatase C-like isoform X2 n=1 Tax=Nelusetta ayraudi TaxID=303726 RepID=UPI003F70553B
MAGVSGLSVLLLFSGIIWNAPHCEGQTPMATRKPATQCTYNVTAVKLGLDITMLRNSGAGPYNITLRTSSGDTLSITSDVNESVVSIRNLKPCTEYTTYVYFIGNGSGAPCQQTGDAIRTNGMAESDVEDTENPGAVCFRSAWDISSSANVTLTALSLSPDDLQRTYCFTPQFHQICRALSVSFSSGNCSLSFARTKNITASEFLNGNEIDPEPPTELPAVINVKLPEACTHLNLNYTCTESGGDGKNKTLKELKPYTDYSCVVNIETESGSTKTTNKVNFKIDCELKIVSLTRDANSTSIRLYWEVENKKCKDLQLEDFRHECRCDPGGKVSEGKTRLGNKASCEVSQLKPYHPNKCKVQLKYNAVNYWENVASSEEYITWTEAGIPEKPYEVTAYLSENNKINVDCKSEERFHGLEKIFRAYLYKNGVSINGHIDKKKCHFEFPDLSYLTSYSVEVALHNGDYESVRVSSKINTAYNDKAVIGFLVFLIILVSVALLFVVYKIFILKRGNSRDSSENLRLISTSQPDEKLMAVEPITSEVLLETYKRKLADEARLFLAEFQSIPRFFVRYSMKEAKKQHNSPRNRYVDILPYDYNRVQLTTGNGEAGCDYINASFIDGYKESKKYIAAQGPKEETVSDFWRMVWEQQSSIIVMVTRCEEGNKIKCAQYWPSPERETEIYEEFIVKLSSEDHCPDYTVRHLCVTNREKNSEREVTHIQFMSWPDHGVPEEAQLLLKLRRRVNAFKNFFSGPIVVHCSAGVGRTGTYIGIDAMMEGLEAEGRVDIYGYVVRLRRQRCLMVQVEAQYILIHQALLEHNQFGETEIPLSELHSTLSTLRSKVPPSEVSLMEEEFERLPSYKNWRTHNAGTTEENRQQNRSSSVIPYDYNRVLLKLDEGHSQDSSHDYEDDDEDESSDEEDDGPTKYINASHINGYWGPHAFIAAQTPLPGTMADFWSMVYQKRASAVVMLSDCEEGDEDCVYWGTDKKTFGDFEVEVTSTETSPAFTSRTVTVRHGKRKESRQVKHLQFLKWSGGELPEKPQDLTDLIKEVKRSSGGGDGNPRAMTTVVHCNDGSSRSGIFCALWKVLDSAEREKLVDVFQVVKTLRKERQGMLSSPEQYQFLYDALESTFPVQNGEAKAVKSSAADSVQLVNETKAAEQPVEEMAASTTRNSQQGGAEGAPAAPEGGQQMQREEPNVSTANGPTVAAEV